MKNKTGRYFLLGYIAYSAIYLCRFNLSIIAPLLETEGRINAAQYGIISGGFLVVYSIGRLINGYIGDKLRAKSIIAVGLFGAGMCNVLLGFFPSFWSLLLFWLLNGYAQSMLWGPLLDTVTRQYDEKKSKYIASLLITSVATGSIAGIAFATFSSTVIGLDAAFILPGVIAILISGIVLLTFHPTQLRPHQISQNATIGRLIRNKELSSMILSAALHGVIKDNLNAWVPIYLAFKFHTDIKSISYYVFAIPFLGLIGRLLHPVIYHIFRKREIMVPIIAFAACAISAIPLVFGTMPIQIDAILLCALAASVSMVNTSILSVYPMRYAQQGCVSTVSGLLDFATYMGAGLSSAIFGFFIESSGYSVIFYTWIAVSVIAIIVLRLGEGKKYETVN